MADESTAQTNPNGDWANMFFTHSWHVVRHSLPPNHERVFNFYQAQGNAHLKTHPMSIEDSAKQARIGKATFLRCRDWLEARGWLWVDATTRPHTVQCADIRHLNNSYGYAPKSLRSAIVEALKDGHVKDARELLRAHGRLLSELPEHGKGKKRQRETDARHKPLLEAYELVLGHPIPSYPREAKAASQLLKQYPDVRVKDVMDCYTWLKGKPDGFWRDKYLSLQSVHKQFGSWLSRASAHETRSEQFEDSSIDQWNEVLA